MSGLPGIPRGADDRPRRGTRSRQVRTTGNVWPARKQPAAEVREPLVDVFDEGDVLLVIVELPGVDEKDIRITVDDDLLRIATRTRGRRYVTELYLPHPVGTVESTYKNGVLEIKLRKEIGDG